MIAWLLKIARKRLSLPRIAAAFVFATIFGFLSAAAHADPLILQTGAAVQSPLAVLLIVLGLETIILALIIRRPFLETLSVCLLANAITGFLGFVALMLVQMLGVPVLPPGPTAAAAALIEGALISAMLVRPPVRRIFVGAVAANLSSAAIAVAVLAPCPLPPPAPGAAQDLALAREMTVLREAIDAYYERYGYFPPYLKGGKKEASLESTETDDPLLDSGVLESYPPNPYARNLRSRRFTATFLLFGMPPVTRSSNLDQPVTTWEARWFPIFQRDRRFGGSDQVLLLANGLSDARIQESFRSVFYHMNSTDYVPGCFFYRSYDFNRDGQADDYILGAYGWPSGPGSVAADLIDGATGDLVLRLDSRGRVHPGHPEPISFLYVAGTPIPGS
jgi:hypothetical protein